MASFFNSDLFVKIVGPVYFEGQVFQSYNNS